MLGAGLQLGRARGDDRFYVPVKARRNQSHQKQQKKLEENQGNRKARSDKRESSSLKSKVSEDSVPPSVVSRSNLDRFLESTIPTIPVQYFSKTTMRGWRTCDVEFQAYFTLADLWESFKEWSAYGAGVPLVLDGSDSVIQYYVPYLSGIQLYGESSMRSNIKSRHSGEDSDGDYYRDSSSDVSSEHEFENALKYMRERQGQYFLTYEISSKMDGVSLSEENSTVQEGFSSDDGESGNSRGCLLFEFLEQDTPYSREPLANKIFDLACCFPGLKTLRSCDLLPASWISVAWYPIYRIPTGPTLKDLDACFLTYHSLSTPMGGNGNSQGPVVVYPSEMDGVPKINLPSFGMASYKFEGSMWKGNGANELPLVNSLLQEAENRLRLLQVNHPDFQFFASNGYHSLGKLPFQVAGISECAD